MRDEQIGRSARSLRHRRGWRQKDVSERARRPRSALVDLEAGRIGNLKVDTIRDLLEAIGARLVIDVVGGAGDPRLLIDAGHAFLEEFWKRRLERWGWLVRAEVSFNRYGERGRIDLLAFHRATGTLLVIEIKTVLWDLQALLGSLDVKVRNARFIAADYGWQVRRVVPVAVVAGSSTTRRAIASHEALFAPFELRGRGAISWARRPRSESAPRGVLILTKLPDVARGDLRRAGRRRVRLTAVISRSTAAAQAST
ncbi:MAG TPA: helix-turn-helix transcriptional regulator [Candidatus Limnocylindria bacterium]|nr:helix-turn-helix transcriptional regulator [Candidatus Limnocylindria bacterium]